MTFVKNRLMWLICAILMLSATTFTSCSDDDVVIDNKLQIINLSGYDFEAIYMSPSSQTTWQDILEDDVFMDKEKINIKLLKSKNQKWDIRLCVDIADIETNYIEFKNLNLTGINTLTLIDHDGELYYTLQ